MKRFLVATMIMIATVVQADDLTDGMEALERGDFKAAVVAFEKSAQEGNTLAQQNLAVMYNNGYGVKENKQIASQWIKKATNSEVVAVR